MQIISDQSEDSMQLLGMQYFHYFMQILHAIFARVIAP